MYLFQYVKYRSNKLTCDLGICYWGIWRAIHLSNEHQSGCLFKVGVLSFAFRRSTEENYARMLSLETWSSRVKQLAKMPIAILYASLAIASLCD